jgi:hypothetical protein
MEKINQTTESNFQKLTYEHEKSIKENNDLMLKIKVMEKNIFDLKENLINGKFYNEI